MNSSFLVPQVNLVTPDKPDDDCATLFRKNPNLCLSRNKESAVKLK